MLIVETGYARLYIQVSTYVRMWYIYNTYNIRTCICNVQLLMGYIYCKVQYMEQLTASHASSMSSSTSPSCRERHRQTDTNTHIQCMCTHLLLNGVIICSLYKIRTKAESSLTHTCTHPHPHTHTLQLSSCNQSWPPS